MGLCILWVAVGSCALGIGGRVVPCPVELLRAGWARGLPRWLYHMPGVKGPLSQSILWARDSSYHEGIRQLLGHLSARLSPSPSIWPRP